MDVNAESKKVRFGKAQKIKRKVEISKLFENGRRWECVSFVIIFSQNNLPHDRLGVIVSKRLGNAVERNRAKRVFREVYRRGIRQSPPFFDILIKPRPRQKKYWDVNEQESFFKIWLSEVKGS